MTDAAGLTLGMRWTPLDAVGLYVPGGKAAYPSSVLMNAIPARVAGVARIAMCVPAPDGVLNPLVLAAARRAGVSEIYRVGGAQAVAALAYGTRDASPRSIASSAPATPMSPRPSARCSAASASTPSPARRRSSCSPTRDNDPRHVAARPAGAGGARRGGAGDPDHRRRRRSPMRSPRRSRRSCPPCPAPRSPARAGRRMARSSSCATGRRRRRWSIGSRPSICRS